MVIAACFALAAARSSPHGNNIQKLLKHVDVRYSDNVFEDANLDVVRALFIIGMLVLR